MRQHLGISATFLGLATTFAGELRSEVAGAHETVPWLTIVGISVTMAAGLYTIIARRAEAQRNYAEARKANLESNLAEQHICEACKAGNPPKECPLGLQPQTCEALRAATRARLNR